MTRHASPPLRIICFSLALLFGLALISPPAISSEFYLSQNDPLFPGDTASPKDFKIQALNAVFKAKERTAVKYTKCGSANAFYDHKHRSIIICNELSLIIGSSLHLTRENAKKTDALLRLAGAQYFILFHEAAHAQIQQLSIPISGREEDVADQLSVWAMYRLALLIEANNIGKRLSSTQESQRHFYLRFLGAMQFMSAPELRHESFGDEHAFSEQRVSNMICWLYGSDIENIYFSELAHKSLPKSRLNKCQTEWQQIARFALLFVHENPQLK